MEWNAGRFLGIGKQLVKEVGADDITGLAAELSYRFFLALFPFAIFLAAVGGFTARAVGVDDPAQEALELLGDNLPPDAASIVSQQVAEVVETRNLGLLSFGILGTIYAASGAMGTVIKALNRAFDVPESRPFWKKQLIALGLTLLTAGGIVVAFAALLAGGAFAQDIADALGFGGAFETLLKWGRIPLAIAVIMVAIAFLYWAAPNTDTPIKWITPGAVLFTLSWLMASIGFAWYVANFAGYNATYGALGGVVILLTWFYLTGLMILVGAELNAILDGKTSEREGEVVVEEKPVPVPAGSPALAAARGAPVERGRRFPLGAILGLLAVFFLARKL